MAGTFTAQSKVRPGAYINFKSVAGSQITPGTRGTVVIPMNLSWGDDTNMIEVTANDYITDRIFEKLGITANSEAAVPLREIFKNAAVALVCRLNTGAVKAVSTVTLSGSEVLTLTARYGGTFGNSITVSCIQNQATSMLELVTTAGGVEVDRQIVTKLSSFRSNPWVDITYSGTGDPEFNTFAGVTLGLVTSGTDGTVFTEVPEDEQNKVVYTKQFNDFMSKASSEIWNVMAIPCKDASIATLVKTYIENLRENNGKKVQAVVFDYAQANYEGIISVDQGYYIGEELVSCENFIAYIAGVTAGATLTESNTFKVVEGATKILNPKTDAQIVAGLENGKLILSMRQDKAVVIEKDINSFHNFTADKNYIFSKNRVIRCLDDIATQVQSIFETSYIGKVNNDESGRTLFKSAIIGYLNEIQAQGAIQNFDSIRDITVTAGNDIESIVCNLAVQPVDSIEKLYMTVVVS